LEAETIGFDEDHVHLLLQAAPRYSPSRVIQIVKSITARELFENFPEIKKELWGGEFWSDGGYIGTVGEGFNADIIRKYIKKQGRKGDQLRLIDFAEP
ncbi:MAG: IS200/IS605 family transposase, partial [Candidatus Micrarchaeota archaeon]